MGKREKLCRAFLHAEFHKFSVFEQKSAQVSCFVCEFEQKIVSKAKFKVVLYVLVRTEAQ